MNFQGNTEGVFISNFSSMKFGRHHIGAYFNGSVDEFGLWNRSLNTSEIATLYNSGTGLSPFVAIVWEEPTPTDATANNTQVILNVSCNFGNINIWFGNISNLNQTHRVITNQPSPANWTTQLFNGGLCCF